MKKIDAVNGKSGYERVHVSFQLTSSCNIATVNSLNCCKNFHQKKERGRGENKRAWVIEMNESRALYLGTYFKIDTIDHLIKNASMFYRTWKYWHAPMLHGKSLAVVVAYDMYCEVAEGNLEAAWKVAKPMDFWSFREMLSMQMLDYDPTSRLYPGDENMRKATAQNKRQRALSSSKGNNGSQTASVTLEQLEGADQRLCGDLSKLQCHLDSVVYGKNGKDCDVCGIPCYTSCGICKTPVHCFPQKGPQLAKDCFLDAHSEHCYGLCRSDALTLFRKRRKDWNPPTKAAKRRNATHIKSLKDNHDDATGDRGI